MAGLHNQVTFSATVHGGPAIVPLTNFIKNFNFSVLSLRAAGKMSGGSPDEVDTSLVKSQLIYWQQEIQLLHLN